MGYERRDGSVSLHMVAPVDLQPGDRPSTEGKEYLWAYCFAESKAELHLTDRILTVRVLAEAFDPARVIADWPVSWRLPASWRVSRSW